MKTKQNKTGTVCLNDRRPVLYQIIPAMLCIPRPLKGLNLISVPEV